MSKPKMKPVKAWMILTKRGAVGTVSITFMAVYKRRRDAEADLYEGERVVRVEIREVVEE